MNIRNGKRLIGQHFIKKSLVLLLLLLPLVFSKAAYAEESQIKQEEIPENTEQGDVGFTVETELPATQVDQSKSFYFSKVNPGEEQTIVLKVRSTSPKEKKVKIYVKEAYTNSNGNVDYDGSTYTRDETLKNSLEELAVVSPKEVTVKGLETKEIKIKITPPAESFDGVKVAAICVMNAESDEEEAGIGSSFGYRVGLVITEDEDVTYDDGSSLNLLQVKPTVHQGKRVIQATLQNPEPKILKNLTVETKLREKGSNEVLRKRTTNDMRMAPNSQFDFATNWGLDPIRSGTYVLSVKASSGEHSWSWDKEFTIGEEQAQKINEEASYTITYPKWVPLVVILLGVLTICAIGALYVRRKKWTSPK